MPKSKLLVCEGAEDAALAEAMIAAQLVPDDIDVVYIGDKTATGFGITGLREYLLALPGTAMLRGKSRLGIFVDNDMAAPNGPVAKYVQNEVREANKHPDINGLYSVPTAAHATSTSGRISTTLVLSPGGTQSGCLETLLVAALRKLYPQEMQCVDSFMQCGSSANATPWAASKADKARVRAALAIIHRQRPQIPLASLWEKAPNVLPITDPLFSPLASALSLI